MAGSRLRRGRATPARPWRTASPLPTTLACLSSSSRVGSKPPTARAPIDAPALFGALTHALCVLPAHFAAIPSSVLFRVQTDLAFRPQWDKFCISCDTIARQAGCEIVYWGVKYPWPLTNRDYVCACPLLSLRAGCSPVCVLRVCHADARRWQQNDDEYVIVSRACPLGAHREELSGFVRVCTYNCQMVISKADRGSRMRLIYQDDPRGNIPKAVVNWAATKGLAGAMADLVRAADMVMAEHKQT